MRTRASRTEVILKIENLQKHENEDIYGKAVKILEHYFGVEEEDSNVVPVVDPNAQQFAFGNQGQMPQQGAFNFGGPMG